MSNKNTGLIDVLLNEAPEKDCLDLGDDLLEARFADLTASFLSKKAADPGEMMEPIMFMHCPTLNDSEATSKTGLGIVPLGDFFSSGAVKQIFVETIAPTILNKVKADAYMLIIEARMGATDDPEILSKPVEVSEMVDVVDVIIIHACRKVDDVEFRSDSYFIMLDTTGKPARSVTLPGQISKFDNLFDPTFTAMIEKEITDKAAKAARREKW